MNDDELFYDEVFYDEQDQDLLYEELEQDFDILKCEISHRGGGIEVSLDRIAKKYQGHKMTTYQNYLGGGMLGKIGNDCTFDDWRNNKKLVKYAEKLSRYMHMFTNPNDEWSGSTFESNQLRSISGY